MERTNSILYILNSAKIRLNVLRCQVPCGIRSVDDRIDQKIKYLTTFIQDLEAKLKRGVK